MQWMHATMHSIEEIQATACYCNDMLEGHNIDIEHVYLRSHI